MTCIPTRPIFPPLRWVAAWYVRMRLRSVELDIASVEQQMIALPHQKRLYEREAAKYRTLLAVVE